MLRFIVSLTFLLLFAVVVGLGLIFSLRNTAPVEVDYLLNTANTPLAVIIIVTFCLGILLTLILYSVFVVWPMRLRVSSLRSAVKSHNQEIASLKRATARS